MRYNRCNPFDEFSLFTPGDLKMAQKGLVFRALYAVCSFFSLEKDESAQNVKIGGGC